MRRLLLLTLLVSVVFCTRPKRQSGPGGYYQGGLSRGPTPKPQPFQQTIVPRFPSLAPQGFRPAPVGEDDDDVDRNTVLPTAAPLLQIVRQPQPTPQNLQYRSSTPVPQSQRAQQPPRRHNQQQPQRGQFPQHLTQEELELEEEEKEEPDRLTLLLPQSKFNCHGKNTGYYADDGLNCEVFHYCQDSARHSWICPEGFLFHQVHLICMPPSNDNICKESAQFHFVNDYLYRPINAEEHQSKPNVTLRYADRYYPENYYEEGEESHLVPTAAPQRARPVQPNYSLRPQSTALPQQFRQSPTPVPQQFRQTIPNQVFHSPEEVNIPLQQRRPTPTPQPHRNYHTSDDFEYRK